MASIKAESFISTAYQTCFFVQFFQAPSTPRQQNLKTRLCLYGLAYRPQLCCYKVFSWKGVKANIRTVILSRWTVERRNASITNSQRCLSVLWKCARNAMLPRACPRFTRKMKMKNEKKEMVIWQNAFWLSEVGPDWKIFGSRSRRTDLEPNIFPSGPPTQSITAWYARN